MKTMTGALLLTFLTALPAWGQEQTDAARLLQSAQEKLRSNDVEGALADLDKAIEADPSNGTAYGIRGFVRANQGQHEEALKDYAKAEELGASLPRLPFLRAATKAALHDYDGAIADYTKAIAANGRDVDAVFRRATLRELTGDLSGAIEDFSTVTTLAPEYGPVYTQRAVAKAALGQFDSAMDDFEAALYLVRPEQASGVYLSRGRVRFDQGELDKAREDFDLGVNGAPESSQGYFSRGLFRHDLGEYKEALADMRKALSIEADAHEYGRLYLCLIRMRLGEADAAKKEMGEYLDQRENKDDWFTKVAGFLAGRLSESDFLAAAENENPHLAREHRCEASWYAGALRQMAGNEAGAKEMYEQCVGCKIHNFIEYDSASAALRSMKKKEG